MLVEIPDKMSFSSFVGYLKGKSSLMIFEKYSNLKYKYGNRHFSDQISFKEKGHCTTYL